MPLMFVVPPRRHSSVSTTGSEESSDIFITPCRSPVPKATAARAKKRTYSTRYHEGVALHSTAHSPFRELMYAPSPGRRSEAPNVETLWNRMLLVQMCSGIYNSARLDAALETGDYERFMPSKATIDLMNECVTIRPEEMKRLKCELEIQEKKLKKKKLMSSAWMLH